MVVLQGPKASVASSKGLTWLWRQEGKEMVLQTAQWQAWLSQMPWRSSPSSGQLQDLGRWAAPQGLAAQDPEDDLFS